MTMSLSRDTCVDTVRQVGAAGRQLSQCKRRTPNTVAMVILINTSLDHSTHADT